jgi:hypothetical protein
MKNQLVRVLGIAVLFASVALIGSLLVTKAIAHESDGRWPDPDPERWGACIQTECGSNKGTQTQTLACSEHHGSNECTPGIWVDSTYIYADGICPTNYHWQNNGNWNERCHRDNGVPHEGNPEHVAPTGCPTDYTQSGNTCRKEDVAGHWETQSDTKDVTRDCTVKDVVACETAPQQPSNQGGPGDGLSDGRSDGRSSCPECTKAPQGQVLGATTDFAATGVAGDMIMNVVGALGGLSTAAGVFLTKRFSK